MTNTPQAGRLSVGSLQGADLAFVGALVLGIFVLLKCYAAARFSLTTASALLTTSPTNVLLGSLTLYAYQLFPLLGLASLCFAVASKHAHGWNLTCLLCAAFAVLAFAVSPLLYIVLTAGPLLLIVLGHFTWRRRAENPKRGSALGHVVAAYLVVATSIVIAASLTALWVPVEAIIYRSSPPNTATSATETSVVFGHVLVADGTWTTVIRGDDRGITRIRSTAVLSRRLCHLSQTQPRGRPPLYYHLVGRSYASPNRGCDTVRTDIVRHNPDVLLQPGSLP